MGLGSSSRATSTELCKLTGLQHLLNGKNRMGWKGKLLAGRIQGLLEAVGSTHKSYLSSDSFWQCCLDSSLSGRRHP